MRLLPLTSITLTALMITLLACKIDAGEEVIIEINEGIPHDDFEYVVADYWKQREIPGKEDTLRATGIFWLVRFKVINHAEQTQHAWDNSIGYIKDKSDVVYENSPRAQQQLNQSASFGWKAGYRTGTDHDDSTILVFDLPEKVRRPYFLVRGKTLIGDVLNRNQFKRTKVKLF